MAKEVSSRIPILVKSPTFIKNMSFWFDGIYSTWTLKFFIWQKSKPVFINQSMVGNCSHSMHIQQVWVFKWLEPQTFFGIRRFNNIEITYHQVGWEIAFLCHPKLGRLFSKYWVYYRIWFFYCNSITFCKGTQVKGWKFLNLYQPLCVDSSWDD